MNMKLLAVFLPLCLMLTGGCFAQTQPTSTTQSTRTGNSTGKVPASGITPRNQQELYDQYNGVNKKPTQIQGQENAPTSGRFGGKPAATGVTGATAESAPAATGGNTSGFRIGIRGGVTQSYFLESRPLIERKYSFVGGLVFQLGAGAVSFQPEINYARISYAVGGFGANPITTTSDQIQVPLFIKFATGSVDGTRLFLNVGPYGAYAYSANIGGSKVSLDGTDGRISYGAAAGVGVMVKAGPGHVTLEARGLYQLGDNSKPSTGDQKTIFAQGTIGYMIPIGGR